MEYWGVVGTLRGTGGGLGGTIQGALGRYFNYWCPGSTDGHWDILGVLGGTGEHRGPWETLESTVWLRSTGDCRL